MFYLMAFKYLQVQDDDHRICEMYFCCLEMKMTENND